MERTYKAWDKTVQKMARDGLAERNLADGTERGISQRPADFSFRQAETGRAGGNRESGKIVEIQGNGHVHGNRRGYSLQTGRGGD